MNLEVVKEGVLTTEIAEKYLSLYLGEENWASRLGELWSRLSNRQHDEDQRKIMMKKIVACALLLPAVDRSVKPNPNLVFWASSMRQFQEKEWWEFFQQVVKRDQQIEGWRKELLALGVIDPIDYAPLTRQAFNWLYEQAEKSGAINDKNKTDVQERLTNVVHAYGGMVVSNIFSKHPEVVRSVLNWRTGYFFERKIYEVYVLDQLKKIKSYELQKTNSQLIKKIG